MLSQDSFHSWLSAKPFSSPDLWESQSFPHVLFLLSHHFLLTLKGLSEASAFFIKPTWGGFLKEKRRGPEWVMNNWSMYAFGDDGDSDWGDAFTALYISLYQRVAVSIVNVCWGKECLWSVKYWPFPLAVRVHEPSYPYLQSWMLKTILAEQWIELRTTYIWTLGSRSSSLTQ